MGDPPTILMPGIGEVRTERLQEPQCGLIQSWRGELLIWHYRGLTLTLVGGKVIEVNASE